ENYSASTCIREHTYGYRIPWYDNNTMTATLNTLCHKILCNIDEGVGLALLYTYGGAQGRA
ncbi:hypothetical protein ACJX0J_008651, partial [Zea mays]